MWSKYKTQREIRGRAVSFEELWKSLSFFLFFLFFKIFSFFLQLKLPYCLLKKIKKNNKYIPQLSYVAKCSRPSINILIEPIIFFHKPFIFSLRLPICRVRKLYHPLIKLEKTKAKTLVSKYCFGHLYRTLRWDRLQGPPNITKELFELGWSTYKRINV